MSSETLDDTQAYLKPTEFKENKLYQSDSPLKRCRALRRGDPPLTSARIETDNVRLERYDHWMSIVKIMCKNLIYILLYLISQKYLDSRIRIS